eukprot:scaffold174992_cov24-Attheya_sp.AAC.1
MPLLAVGTKIDPRLGVMANLLVDDDTLSDQDDWVVQLLPSPSINVDGSRPTSMPFDNPAEPQYLKRTSL